MARGGEMFILDMGKPVRIVDLARSMIRLAGLVPDVDIKIEYVGLRPGEKLYEELLLSSADAEKTDNNRIFVVHPEPDAQNVIDGLLRELGELGVKDDVSSVLARIEPTFCPEKGCCCTKQCAPADTEGA